ncbi:esterase-like activity of phytase family protein [Falsihalocynthiibacter arcticus]|uniref:Phytase-like domain-containing protein n=1 Tax=Falsihalocynthiibacter arcticus TaxID=1579316 RepID=A0A126UY37_9RHOB|nr:esterase-like activity of phytase family protein [Falsihalocynthiibacter arcticus]AML50978.1 hypothetical protein RC74_06540 [Falsihalocynthiibacter arcticus]
MRSSFVVAIAVLALIGLFSQGLATSITSKARYVGSILVPQTSPENGGFSGLSLDTSGDKFLTITDHGTFFSGHFLRENNAIKKIIFEQSTPLLSTEGLPVLKPGNDSEGLSVRKDGQIFVSFEGPARVLSYRNTLSKAVDIPVPESFMKLPKNGALEALAVAPNGALFTLAEGVSKHTNPHSVFRYFNGKWKLFATIERRGKFLPVDAEFGPDGKFYLLERNFSVLAGFQSRVRRFDIVGNDFGQEDVILESTFGQHGNLEGLSVWRDALGNTRLTMIADNNFKFFLRSEIVEYSLTE